MTSEREQFDCDFAIIRLGNYLGLKQLFLKCIKRDAHDMYRW